MKKLLIGTAGLAFIALLVGSVGYWKHSRDEAKARALMEEIIVDIPPEQTVAELLETLRSMPELAEIQFHVMLPDTILAWRLFPDYQERPKPGGSIAFFGKPWDYDTVVNRASGNGIFHTLDGRDLTFHLLGHPPAPSLFERIEGGISSVLARINSRNDDHFVPEPRWWKLLKNFWP
ncbi:hypothetical protein BH23VER1_BH23VER1_00420 [soil metagenome]